MRCWRADLDEAHGVDPGDAAPAGANLDHVDRRHRHRKSRLERVNRRERATSSSSVIGIAPSRMMLGGAATPALRAGRSTARISSASRTGASVTAATTPLAAKGHRRPSHGRNDYRAGGDERGIRHGGRPRRGVRRGVQGDGEHPFRLGLFAEHQSVRDRLPHRQAGRPPARHRPSSGSLPCSLRAG